jgi:hypothetical protein
MIAMRSVPAYRLCDPGGLERLQSLANVPSVAADLSTILAAVLPGYSAANWYGMLAPK